MARLGISRAGHTGLAGNGLPAYTTHSVRIYRVRRLHNVNHYLR